MEGVLVLAPVAALALFAISSPAVGRLLKSVGKEKYLSLWSALGFAVAMLCLAYLSQDLPLEYPEVSSPLFPTFYLDWLSLFFAAVFAFLGFMASLYSTNYMEHYTGLTQYYTLLLLMVAGMVGVVISADLFTLYIFWELMAVSSYCLVAFKVKEWEPVEAGMKYALMSTVGSIVMLYGFSYLYGVAGTLNLFALAEAVSKAPPSPFLYGALASLVFGFGIKAAMVPLHTWLPDAHPAAPSPISAMLSGVVIKVGVYALMRFVPYIFPLTTYDWPLVFAIAAVLSMTAGNILALLQDDIKRLLAFSSINQVGYILIGIAIATKDGLVGSVLHFFAHATMKGLAFLCAGALFYVLGTRSLTKLTGAGRKMPITTVTFSIALFGLIGAPPLNGFISKFILFTAAVAASGVHSWAPWLAVAGVLNSAFSAAVYLRVLWKLLLDEPSEEVAQKARDPPFWMAAIMIVLAAVVVSTGMFPEAVVALAEKAAEDLLPFVI